MAHLLGAESVGLQFPTKVIFESVTLGIGEGDRIGVVGRNGDGKSTLLALLSGVLRPDSGRVTHRRGLDVGLFTQTDALDDRQTVERTIVGAVDEQVWARDARTRDIVDGLIKEIPWQARIGELSGGQRRRVGLGALLVRDHEVVMLDEPTNHLDIEAITWLAEHLKRRWSSNAGGLVVVTHDRWFLDEVTTTTWEVHDGKIDSFEGGYAAYILQRVERDRMAAVTEAKRQNLARKELAWLRRGAPARTSKSKFRVEAANVLIADEPPVRDSIVLERMATARLGRDVIDLLDVSVSFGDTEVLRDIDWRLAPGQRIGILGANGAGKTTLLNLITGDLKPTSGTVKRGKTVKVARLAQLSGELDSVGNERVSDVVAKKRTSYQVGGKELSGGQLLERLGFTSAHLSSPVKELSGGQKRRLQLLLLLLDQPNVLVMDEPSNDLDTDMLAAVEDLLDSWPGTLVVVSHDRYMMERVTDIQYAVINGSLQHLPRGVDQYLTLRRDRSAARPIARGASSSQSHKYAVAERHAAQKELASIEKKLSKLPAQIARTQQRIDEHDPSNYMGLSEHVEALSSLNAKQSELETRWLELTDQLE